MIRAPRGAASALYTDAHDLPGDDDARPLFTLCAAIVAGALSAAALFGWATGEPVLARVVPGLAAMNPVTAAALLVAAAALALPARHLWAVRVLAGLVLAVGMVKLTQMLTGAGGGVDLLQFPSRLAADGSPTLSRIAPNTGVAIVLLGGGLLASASRRRAAILASQLLALGIIAIALLVLVGYVLDFAGSHRQVYNMMALNTALALVALAAAIVGRHRQVGLMRILGDRGPAGSVARMTLPFALLIPVLVGLVRLSGERAGFYGTGDGVALQVFANILVTFVLLAACIVMLSRSDRARRARELALMQSEGQYRHAEQVGHIGHWRIEYPSGTVEWSDEFRTICGLSPKAVPGVEATLALFHPDDAVVGREIVRRAISECRAWEIGYRIRRPDGEVRHLRSHGVCDHGRAGEVIAMFGVIVDVTELEESRREAEAASASKAAFLANMSHEIRTPMSGVMGFVELLMDSDLDISQRRHLVLIQESAQALLKLLNDILDLSKIEAGQLEVNPEPSDVRRDIEQCVRLMTPIAEQKGLELSAEIDGDFPAQVMVDSLRLRQIVFNLLGNAVKFTNRGSVTVTLRTGLDAKKRRTIFIGVSDTGVGIDPARKSAIFEAFVQADVSISRRFGGSGLGLSISRRLARLMDGTIELESEEGLGTLVTLALPLTEAHGRARLEERRTPRDGPSRDVDDPALAARASILLVEDIDINREMIAEMLIRLGHDVEVAANGAEALDCARRLTEDPQAWDMILMDVQMPVMDGLTATRAIRALGGRAATIPIVALTANAFAAEVQGCRDAGMNDHVAKPTGFAQLKRAVERWSAGQAARIAAETRPEPALPTLAERFQARRLASGDRLAELISELGAADGQPAQPLREAAEIAHVFAGTAAMFGEGQLGKVARRVEAEIKLIARERRPDGERLATEAIGRLVVALGAPAGQ
jgi:PAS domain S-box-containing protein